jgi:mono/diheme cytochrome c family protein
MNNLSDNFIVAIIVGVLLALAASLVGGALIAALAGFGSRFFRRNLPTDEEMSQLKAEYNKPGRTLGRPRLGPVAEPFVISVVGFILFFIVSSAALGMMAKPVRGADSAAGDLYTDATPAAGLSKTGDFTAIVNELPPGNAEAGAKLYTSLGCAGCHSLKKDERLVGPTFYNVYDVAGTRVPGLGAKEYLYQSIVDPNTHVVDTYQPNLMPQTFASQLSPQQMADLLAWLEQSHSNQP